MNDGAGTLKSYVFKTEDTFMWLFIGAWVSTEKPVYKNPYTMAALIFSMTFFSIFMGFIRICAEGDRGKIILILGILWGIVGTILSLTYLIYKENYVEFWYMVLFYIMWFIIFWTSEMMKTIQIQNN